MYILTDYHNNNFFYKFLKFFFIIIVYVNNYNLIESFEIVEGKETVSTVFSVENELFILFIVKNIPIINISRNKIVILYKRFINNVFCINKDVITNEMLQKN